MDAKKTLIDIQEIYYDIPESDTELPFILVRLPMKHVKKTNVGITDHFFSYLAIVNTGEVQEMRSEDKILEFLNLKDVRKSISMKKIKLRNAEDAFNISQKLNVDHASRLILINSAMRSVKSVFVERSGVFALFEKGIGKNGGHSMDTPHVTEIYGEIINQTKPIDDKRIGIYPVLYLSDVIRFPDKSSEVSHQTLLQIHGEFSTIHHEFQELNVRTYDELQNSMEKVTTILNSYYENVSNSFDTGSNASIYTLESLRKIREILERMKTDADKILSIMAVTIKEQY